jgi:integrase
MSRAAAMVAEGLYWTDIGQQLGIGIRQLTLAHPELWRRLLDEAEAKMVVTIRAEAGTDAVLSDPTQWVRSAKLAEHWLAARGEPLFPADPAGGETLSRFFERYYVPLSTAQPQAMYQYRNAVRLWTLSTGDPPLVSINPPLLARFKTFLSNLRGVKPHLRFSPRSVLGRLGYIQSILDKAGPPSRHCRDAADILHRVPWVRPPKVPQPIPQIVTDVELGNCYLAAIAMPKPEIRGFKPADWWRALLVTVYNTGLRRRTLLGLRMEYIDWEGRRIVIPPRDIKSGRGHVAYLNDTTLEHLRRIRTNREFVFEWPGSQRQMYLWWHRLQTEAGIPWKEHFGLHDIRRTTATRLWEFSPQAAQLALGHAGQDVTIRHYVQGRGIVQRAVDALPQPKAFTNP